MFPFDNRTTQASPLYVLICSIYVYILLIIGVTLTIYFKKNPFAKVSNLEKNKKRGCNEENTKETNLSHPKQPMEQHLHQDSGEETVRETSF